MLYEHVVAVETLYNTHHSTPEPPTLRYLLDGDFCGRFKFSSFVSLRRVQCLTCIDQLWATV